MTTVSTLESMGLTLGLTSDGNLSLEGLKRLSDEQREYALSVAKEHKPAILHELRRRKKQAPGNRFEAYWYETCPDYWRGCSSCPDADLYHYDEDGKPYALRSDFCKRHPRPSLAVLQ